MTRDEILTAFEKLRVWRKGGQRAPHKPLLALLALGEWQRTGNPKIAFTDIEDRLASLLAEFGPPRRSHHPELPYFHMTTDGIWQIDIDTALLPERKRRSIPKSFFHDNATPGGFSPDILMALAAEPALVDEIAGMLLEAHFPPSIHEDILIAAGLRQAGLRIAQPRDPSFRPRILTAYEYRCALCDFDLRIGNSSVAIEAAHVRWKQANGPDHETNGVALCVLHHKLFDLGAFTVAPDLTVLVSEMVNGPLSAENAILRFHGSKLRPPQRPEHHPEPEHLGWHRHEVFRGRERHLAA